MKEYPFDTSLSIRLVNESKSPSYWFNSQQPTFSTSSRKWSGKFKLHCVFQMFNTYDKMNSLDIRFVGVVKYE